MVGAYPTGTLLRSRRDTVETRVSCRFLLDFAGDLCEIWWRIPTKTGHPRLEPESGPLPPSR